MSQLKLEVGKYYKQRDGSKACVVAITTSDTAYAAIGWRGGDGDGISWALNGKYYGLGDSVGSDYDLVAEWVEPVPPKQKVKMWPALCKTNDDNAWLSCNLYPDEISAGAAFGKAFVRLLTEYPAAEVEV